MFHHHHHHTLTLTHTHTLLLDYDMIRLETWLLQTDQALYTCHD